MKEIIAYAGAHQVEIIPEIEMPAHTNSSLAAYPELACPIVKDFISVIPGMGAHASEIVYCAGNDKVFSFLEDVIDEVADLFPSHYIHLGGDEASKKILERMSTLSGTDESRRHHRRRGFTGLFHEPHG